MKDEESGPEAFSETSRTMNPNLRGRDIREAFDTDEYQILLVANKFQTGFDQPLLCGMYVDKRLAGITAVQTLSRLNRAYDAPGVRKDTTYVVDFRNDPAEILKAFQTYYETAALENVTDPNIVFDLRMKLDSTGHYDEFEVDRVVEVVMDAGSRQGDLVRALEPVASRLLRRYREALDRYRVAKAREESKGAEEAHAEMELLELFKGDMGAFLRVYAFLSQIFDYGNTAIEKRFVFYKRLLPLLEFGREREGIDLSKVLLTHHNLRNQGRRDVGLAAGEGPALKPMTEVGGGSVQEKERALLAEIIGRVNGLFEGELTDDDRLVYVNNVIKGKLLESLVLAQQAVNNTKEQFANSPDLSAELLNAIMDALAAHSTMSRQALESERVRSGLREILLGPGKLWEALRERAAA